MSRVPLDGVRVFFSTSVPADVAGTLRAVNASALITTLLGGLLAGGGRVVFGGHPSITPLVHHFVARGLGRPDQVELHQLRRFAKVAPRQTWDAAVFPHPKMHGAEVAPSASGLDDELGEMRDAMARAANAAVFAGGQPADGSLTKTPGLRDELDRFRRAQPRAPVFLTRLLGGYTAEALIPEAERGVIDVYDGLDPREQAVLWRSETVETVSAIVLDALAAAKEV